MQSVGEHVGERIRFFRIASGMKQKDLAALLGISYQQIQKYETGRDKVNIDRLFEIAEIFNVPILSFLDLSDQEDTSLSHNRQTLSLMHYFSLISDKKTSQLVVDIVKILSEKDQVAMSLASEDALEEDHIEQ